MPQGEVRFISPSMKEIFPEKEEKAKHEILDYIRLFEEMIGNLGYLAQKCSIFLVAFFLILWYPNWQKEKRTGLKSLDSAAGNQCGGFGF